MKTLILVFFTFVLVQPVYALRLDGVLGFNNPSFESSPTQNWSGTSSLAYGAELTVDSLIPIPTIGFVTGLMLNAYNGEYSSDVGGTTYKTSYKMNFAEIPAMARWAPLMNESFGPFLDLGLVYGSKMSGKVSSSDTNGGPGLATSDTAASYYGIRYGLGVNFDLGWPMRAAIHYTKASSDLDSGSSDLGFNAMMFSLGVKLGGF